MTAGKGEIENKKNTSFYQQYQVIAEEYNYFSQNTPYQIRPNTVVTSQMISIKEIKQKLKTEQIWASQEIDVNASDYFDQLNISEDSFQAESSTQAQILQTNPPKSLNNN